MLGTWNTTANHTVPSLLGALWHPNQHRHLSYINKNVLAVLRPPRTRLDRWLHGKMQASSQALMALLWLMASGTRAPRLMIRDDAHSTTPYDTARLEFCACSLSGGHAELTTVRATGKSRNKNATKALLDMVECSSSALRHLGLMGISASEKWWNITMLFACTAVVVLWSQPAIPQP